MALRSTSSNQVNASSITVTLPAGAAVGDLCYFFAASAWPWSVFPSGWTIIDSNTGTTWNHFAAYKILILADVTAGNVTITATNTYQMNGGIACFVGAPVQREAQIATGSPGTASCTGAVLSSDTGVYWLSARNSGVAVTITPSVGSVTIQQQNNLSDGSYALCTQAMPGGVQTNTYTNSGTAYFGIQIIVEVGGAGANMLINSGLDAMGNRGQLKGGMNA